MRKAHGLVIPLLTLAAATMALGQSRSTGPQLPAGVKAEMNLVFAQVDVKAPGGGTQKKDLDLDLYLPTNAATGKLPVIVWVHGGAWSERNTTRPKIPWIAAEGYAVAAIDHRMSGEMPWPAQIHDCKAAVRWLRANAAKYNLDPDRIGAAGDSSGGHLAAMLGVTGDVKELEGDSGNKEQSSAVRAVIDFFGPSDLVALAQTPGYLAAKVAVGKLNGGIRRDWDDPAKAAVLLEKAKTSSVTTYISKNDPPFLILHATGDTTVPIAQSRVLHEALTKAGVPSTLVEIPGGEHDSPWSEFYDGPAAKKRILEFFDKNVKNAPAAPSTAPASHEEPATKPATAPADKPGKH